MLIALEVALGAAPPVLNSKKFELRKHISKAAVLQGVTEFRIANVYSPEPLFLMKAKS
jgi:hypothetical protein